MSARQMSVLPAVVALCIGTALGAATHSELRGDVEFLASAELEGRLTGTEGEQRAAAFIEKRLESIGAVPLPGSDEFRHAFEFTAGTRDAGSTLALELATQAEPLRWQDPEQIRGLSFSDNGTIGGAVVFAGYGLTVPDSQGVSYDSYHGLDVADKIVLVLRYTPEDVDDETRAELARYSDPRYKALLARDNGAKAVLIVTGPNSANAGRTIDSRFDAALSGSGIVAASIGGEVAERMFAGVEGGLSRAQGDLDEGNPHVRGFELPDLRVRLEVKIDRERRTGHNVIGYLPPSSERPAGAAVVMLGAHYDHLGRGRHGNSRANKNESGQIHHGADDNASGVATVLAAGLQLARRQRERGVVLAFWSGEELGLLGSSDFIKSGALPVDRIAAYLNFDMVGRMRDDRLNLQGAGSSTVWPRLIEQANVASGLDVRTQSDPYLPTDASVLYLAQVPVLSFFTGSHDDYHRPTDRAEGVNYEGLEQIAGFAARFAARLVALEDPPEYVQVQRSRESTGSRDSVRAYTGTIPDYATEVEGLQLSGVIEGGPADLAGIRAGDVIVEFAGRQIANIYDYTYALDAVKVDQPVRVVCMRDDERMEFTITPTSRP